MQQRLFFFEHGIDLDLCVYGLKESILFYVIKDCRSPFIEQVDITVCSQAEHTHLQISGSILQLKLFYGYRHLSAQWGRGLQYHNKSGLLRARTQEWYKLFAWNMNSVCWCLKLPKEIWQSILLMSKKKTREKAPVVCLKWCCLISRTELTVGKKEI